MYVTRGQIIKEYELLKQIEEKIRVIKIPRRVRLKHKEHHKPAYMVHGWIDVSIIGYLADSFGVSNRFYEPSINLDFRKPITRETLGETVELEYMLIKFADRAQERRVLFGYNVAVRSKGEILAQTSRPLFYIGPNPEIFLPSEAHLAR